MGIALGCVGCRVSLHIGWQVVWVLKDIWSSFCDRGGGAGSLVSRPIKMLRQDNECNETVIEDARHQNSELTNENLCIVPEI